MARAYFFPLFLGGVIIIIIIATPIISRTEGLDE